MIAVIDYGAGNLRSAVRALQHVGADLEVTDDAAVIARADGVVLPGVGATLDTMNELRRRGLVEVIPQVIARGTPFLGICVGMQVLAQTSTEFGDHDCLGVVPGTVRKLPDTAGKVPQIGWNQVRIAKPDHPLFAGIPDGTDFYFVHSFYVDLPDPQFVAGWTDYGIAFPSVLAFGSAVATQFHPEKSGRWGLALLHNFVELVQSDRGGIADRVSPLMAT
jgi:imidazole glycerol-phosphate synthase subunit HisH